MDFHDNFIHVGCCNMGSKIRLLRCRFRERIKGTSLRLCHNGTTENCKNCLKLLRDVRNGN